jgi:hypothetical protein
MPIESDEGVDSSLRVGQVIPIYWQSYEVYYR